MEHLGGFTQSRYEKQNPFWKKKNTMSSGSLSPERRGGDGRPGFRGLGGACAPGKTPFPCPRDSNAGVKKGWLPFPCPTPTRGLETGLISDCPLSLSPSAPLSQTPNNPGLPGHFIGCHRLGGGTRQAHMVFYVSEWHPFTRMEAT